MIDITDKTMCCGCSACAQACPKHCISMTSDHEGFLYPTVDRMVCVECGLCEKVCHELHPYDERMPLKVYAAINKDEAIRMNSSSGGIFYLLAEKTIAEGGVVFGARFDEQWQVVIDHAETLDKVYSFLGSKYVQARTEDSYKKAQAFLKSGRKVLFSGSPCQIAGLHHFLRKTYDNLITVDFVCHGVPSPKVWRLYLNEVVSSGRRAINDVKFRQKGNGWKRFNFLLSYHQEGHSYTLCCAHRENHYMRAFLSDMILRPSCYSCQAKEGRSRSDLTIADFWGIQREMPEMDDDKGTSLLLIHSEKGMQALDWSQLTSQESTLAVASKYNGGLTPVRKLHPKREKFFAKLNTSSSVISWIDHCLRPPFKVRVYVMLSNYKQLIVRLVKKLIGGGNSVGSHIMQSEVIPPMLRTADITHITFRDKQTGWKSYRMEIKMK